MKYDPNQPRVPRGDSDGGQWTGGGGGGSSSARAGSSSSGTSDDRVLSDAVDPGYNPGDQVAQAEPQSSGRVDLHEHEARGGHTISEHVGRDDNYLLARVRGERGPFLVRKRAGSFPSLEAATKLVSSTLARNRDIVDRVARGEVFREFVTSDFDVPTGREAYAPSEYAQPYLRDTYGVGVSLQHDPSDKSGIKIIAAYPRNPE